MSDQPDPTRIPGLEITIESALEMRIFGGRELNLHQRLEIAKHLHSVLSSAGYGNQHAAYEQGFSTGFDRAADDIGAWENIVEHGEDDIINPYPVPVFDVAR